LGRLTWAPGTIAEIVPETPTARTLGIDVAGWPGHRAGEHVDLRLTAEDGYQAVRSYSLSAPAAGERIFVTIERLDDGEVSPYLVDDALVGDQLEVRGPIGGHFVWGPEQGGPLLLIAGGSGIVPLAAMLRLRADRGDHTPTRLLYSARTPAETIFRAEIDRLAAADGTLEVTHTFTRGAPPDWTGYRRRIDPEMIAAVAWPAERDPLAFVCGSTGFVELAASALVDLGYDPARVKTERFGPTGSG
jgi:ferredoxin-NADP reductase